MVWCDYDMTRFDAASYGASWKQAIDFIFIWTDFQAKFRIRHTNGNALAKEGLLGTVVLERPELEAGMGYGFAKFISLEDALDAATGKNLENLAKFDKFSE